MTKNFSVNSVNSKVEFVISSLTSSNVWSGSDDELCASLTFATEFSFSKGKIKTHFPLTDLFGNEFPDAYTAYQFYKFDPSVGQRHILVMKIAKAKFKQYPWLLVDVKERGGYEWLVECQLTLPDEKDKDMDAYWEGVGLESPFICCLAEAYKRLEQELDFNSLLPF